MRAFIIFLFSFCVLPILSAQTPYTLRDHQGRQVIPRGFVNNTEDHKGDIHYTQDDYFRMAKMGANFQVIRLGLGRLGGYPGNELEDTYLQRLDSMVQMAKNVGISTDFKLTVYGSKGFSWGDFWRNNNGEFDLLEKAWTMLWKHYKDEPVVFGYDLLNEPMRGDLDVSYEEMEAEYLIPLYKRLIDVCQQIDSGKKILYQPISVPICSDWDVYFPPFIEMKTPVERENIIYAPHMYEGDKSRIRKWITRYEKDAAVSGAPMFMGEWGSATYDEVDSTLSEQHKFIDFYVETVHVFDSLGLGSIKPWFTGTRSTSLEPEWEGWDKDWWKDYYTWSIFKDNNPVGTVERKYIIDILSRPYPQCIAGEIMEYRFDLPTRSFHLSLKADNSLGISRIFIPVDRHYPDGFTVTIGETQFIYNPLKNTGLEVSKTDKAGHCSNWAQWPMN
jgi:endoglycosylceramidase